MGLRLDGAVRKYFPIWISGSDSLTSQGSANPGGVDSFVCASDYSPALFSSETPVSQLGPSVVGTSGGRIFNFNDGRDERLTIDRAERPPLRSAPGCPRYVTADAGPPFEVRVDDQSGRVGEIFEARFVGCVPPERGGRDYVERVFGSARRCVVHVSWGRVPAYRHRYFSVEDGKIVRLRSGELFCHHCFRCVGRAGLYHAWPRSGTREILPWCSRCRLELVYVFELKPGVELKLRTHAAEQPAVLAEREGFFVA